MMENTKYSGSLKKYRGFTLVEFMIAAALGVVLLAVIGTLYSYTRQLNSVAETRLGVQESLRTAGSIIVRDARQAGNFGCISMGRIGDINSKVGANALDFKSLNIEDRFGGLADDYKIENPQESSVFGSFGVRWFKPDAASHNGIALTGKGRMLMFYYGQGSAGLTALNNTGLTFDDTADPVRTVQSTADNGGYLALASCTALDIFQSNSGGVSFAKNNNGGVLSGFSPDIEYTTLVGGTPVINKHLDAQIELMRYMVVGYAVGASAQEAAENTSSLYRFELQENGTWSNPERLVSDVTDMDVGFVYTSNSGIPGAGSNDEGCASTILTTQSDIGKINDYGFTTDIGGAGKDGYYRREGGTSALYLPPALLRIELTYRYPLTAIGKSFTDGSTDTDRKTYPFYINAAIRGGNTCANRVLANTANLKPGAPTP